MHVTKIQRRKAFKANVERILSPLTIIIRLQNILFGRLFPAMHTNLKVITKFPRKDQIKLLSEGVQYLHFLHISSLFCVNMQSCDLGTLHFFSAQSQMFRVNLWPGKQCHLKGARPGWGLRALGFEKCFKKSDMIPHKKPGRNSPKIQKARDMAILPKATIKLYFTLNYTSH